MVDGQRKGNVYENDICRLLSTWLVPGDWAKCPVYELPFRRRFTDTTPLVGHWDGEGDILHRPGIQFPFCVECKNQEGWDLDGALINAKWPPWGWWEQAKDQAAKVWLVPILFFTRRFRPTYVMVQEEVAKCLKLKGNQACIQRQNGERVVVSSAENLERVPRRLVRRLAKSSPRAC